MILTASVNKGVTAPPPLPLPLPLSLAAAARLRFLPQLMETRKEFVRIGEDLETAAAKNAQVSRHKVGEAERASHLLLATRKCHQHFALDYCLQVGRQPLQRPHAWDTTRLFLGLYVLARSLQLNTFKTQQRVDILNSVSSAEGAFR